MTSGARTFHFISGLPRSGAALLAALLQQNPRFHAGVCSPVGALMSAWLQRFSAGSEYGPVLTRAQRQRLLRGLFDSYYDAPPLRPVVFDVNPLWCGRLPTLLDLFPGAKVIACVRNVAWVMDSLERLYRANPYEHTPLYGNDAERNTVYSRVDALAQRHRPVGAAWAALKEAFYGEHAQTLLLVEYDLLAQAPEKVLRLMYEFIGEPWHAHEYANLRGPGVRPQVAAEPRRTVLPPDLFEQHAASNFWRDAQGSAAHVIRVRADEPVPALP
jgi:sulfotransferase